MSAAIEILRAGPLATIQDDGRPGHLKSGISASGPMMRNAFQTTGVMLENPGSAGIEFTMTGIDFEVVETPIDAAFAGGAFNLTINSHPQDWPCRVTLQPGDHVNINPGPEGNYGYVRFGHEIDVPVLLGSRATNLIAGLGGFEGRVLRAGDILPLVASGAHSSNSQTPSAEAEPDALFRFVWGIHADRFDAKTRTAFTSQIFKISTRIDRMGARLDDPAGVFAGARFLSLVSDAVVPGDIQILGDGTPIILLRDHQPTGGYPRIGTVISADLDRFAQIRPHQEVRFSPVTLQKSHTALTGKTR